MPKFRKKPVIVEAVQWFKHGDHEGVHRLISVESYRVCKQCNNFVHQHGWIDTLEGGHIVCPGDFIITGVKGERYSCKPDIFEATYEPVPDETYEPA